MTTAHTPGPWEFRVYSGGTTIVSKHNAPGRSVRDSLKGVTVQVDAFINDDQSNAAKASPDARLIAAAPDLLEQLKLVLPILEGINSRCTSDTAMILNVRAAIAKATGGEV